MTASKFNVDLQADNSERKGVLFIADLDALLLPATAWHPYRTDCDIYHACRVLDLGNEEGIYPTHIFTELNPAEAHKQLDQVVYAYCDVCNMEWWCDARIQYFVNGDLKDTQDRYGSTDDVSNYQITFKVHCSTPANQVQGLIAKILETTASEYYYIARAHPELACEVSGYSQKFVDDGNPPSAYPPDAPDDTIVD